MTSIPFLRARIGRHLWAGIGFIALFTTTRQAAIMGWDDTFYVAQLTSAVADHDLLLQDDLLAFQGPLGHRLRRVTTILDSGAVQNAFSVGFAVVHGTYAWPLVALAREPGGVGLRRLLAVGSLGVLILTALSTVRLCERWGFEPGISRLATGIALASGPLALFGTRVYMNSHLLSALLAALTLLAFVRAMEGSLWRDAAFVGFAAGLLVINRWQDAVFLIALAPALAASLGGKTGPRRPTPFAFALAVAGFSALVFLQLLAWRAQFSSWLLVPQGSGYIQWISLAAPFLLLSPYHGVVPWAPGLALGLALAPFLAAPRETPVVRGLRRGFLLMLPVFVYVSASPRDWWAGDSYGPRRLATLAPVAAVGIAGLLRRLRPGWRAVLSGALVLWAVITVSAYMSGFDDLWVLLRGSPGLFNPQPASAYEGVHWIDPWGPFHALKPGFTFSDKPHNADRLLGALTCAALLGLVTWCWNRLRGSARAQRTALACVAAWVMLCAAWLAVVVPSNDDWNRRWKAVVHGEAEPPGTRPFPTDVADAALLLRAVHSLKAGDETAFREGWSRLRTRGAFGIDEEEVRALARPGHTNER